MHRANCVSVDSRDRSRRVDGVWPGTIDELGEACGARDIKSDEGPAVGRRARGRGCLLPCDCKHLK